MNCFVITLFLLCIGGTIHPFTVVLDPSFSKDQKISEETVTYAMELKHHLQAELPSLKIALSRSHEQKIEQQDSASFANRLQADLFIHLSLYVEKENNRSLSIYSFAYDPITDFWPTKPTPLSFIPVDRAHIFSARTSKKEAATLTSLLSKSLHSSFALHMPICLPYKPLKGILAPALGLEVMLTHAKEWRLLLPNLIPSLIEIIKEMEADES